METGDGGRSDSRRIPVGLLTAGAGIATILVLFLLFCFDPAVSRFFPPCLLHEATGLHCPGCGSLRSLHQLLHGHPGRAFSLNPLLILSLPILALAPFFRSQLYRASVAWTAFAVLLAYGILRNIPLWPFTLLAPH